ncbi:MAG: cell division protein ZapA [Burkholderiaceae bacterium]
MEQIEVKILGRDFKLAVTEDERERLLQAATMVDEKMRSIRDAGKINGIDRIAVLAALQLAHEMLSGNAQVQGEASPDLARRIRRISDELDAEIKRQESLF